MSTRIPLPGNMIDTLLKGMDTGSNMYSRSMHPILEREKQKQLEQHFQEQLKLNKASDGRNALLMPLRLQELKDKHASAQFERSMMNQLMGGGSSSGESGMDGVAIPQQIPTQEMGEGMGMFAPEVIQQEHQSPVRSPSKSPNAGGINLDSFRKNPILRGFFKHKFGIDPLAEDPLSQDEKDKHSIDLFNQKEEIKQKNKTGDIATGNVLTKNQTSLQAIDTVIPMLDELINNPQFIYGPTDFSPAKKAAYNAKTGGMIDILVASQSLPQVKESINLVESQIRRQPGESVNSYVERIKDLKKDLLARRGKSKSVVKSKRINTEDLIDLSSLSDDELRKIAGGEQ